ncbi:MAG: hypothetical protein S4CHLAM45_00180 [Chlamydiales bacterium]|nr:hypothetical protein [Chlamydiales bacterium]MCH9619343.1 hypothetical protein [Chlamydiales bacterium]MCH9622147.1 hypothetical protein [Chlamydiales bacterium]
MTVAVEDGIPLFLDDYLEKLRWQCDQLAIPFPKIDRAVFDQLEEKNGLLRLLIIDRKGSVAYTLDPYVKRLTKRAYRMTTLLAPPQKYPQLKTAETLHRINLLKEVKLQGFDDALLTTSDGVILEAIFGNLFWIVGETLYTPSRTLPLYFGVTLNRLINGWKGEVKEVEVKELSKEAKLFRCSTLQGVIPVASITLTLKEGSPPQV